MAEGGDDTGDITGVVAGIIVVIAIFLIVFVLSIVLFPLLGPLSDIMDNLVNKVLMPLMTWAIAQNPNIYVFRTLIGDIIKIMSLLYIVGIILSGLYIVLVSSSPVERARAKSIILRLIAGLILLSVSMQAYDVLLKVSEGLTLRILAGVKSSGAAYFAVVNGTVAGVLIGSFMEAYLIAIVPLLLLVALISIGMRYIAVALFGILFPITITLYFIEVTRGIGANLMRYTLMIILTQPVTAIMLYITIMSLNSLGEIGPSKPVAALLAMFIGTAGFILVALAPLIMMDIMKWFGGALAAYGMVLAYDRPTAGGALVALGGYAAGMGPEAMVVGYSMKTLGDHALGEKGDSQMMLMQARREIAAAKGRGWNPDDSSTAHLSPNLSTDHLRKQVSEAKHHRGSVRGWGREDKLYRRAIDDGGPTSTYDMEINSAENLLPAPVEGVLQSLDTLKRGASSLGRSARGMGGGRAEINNFNKSLEGANDTVAVGTAAKTTLTQLGMSDPEAAQWAASIENSPNADIAKDKARAAIIYNRIRTDNRFGTDFLDGIRNDIQSGNTDAMKMDRVANRIKAHGKLRQRINRPCRVETPAGLARTRTSLSTTT
jgi:hypothetical protein